MPSRLERLMTIAVETGDIFLKVCPHCQAPHSRFDTHCIRCTKWAKKIEQILKLKDIRERKEAGQAVSKEELELLRDNNVLSFVEVTPHDYKRLNEAPFELPTEMSVVRQSFKNRLQFFLDRMQVENRKMTTTQAAAKLLKFDSKDDFVNFAIDHGIRSVMTADWEQHFAAWKVEDILALFHERQAEKSTKTLVENAPDKLVTSIEAANMLKIPGARLFIELATNFGIKPARTFGERPEQMTWNISDVEVLRHVHELETDAKPIREAIQRVERDIAALNEQPMKYPEMQALRKKTEDLKVLHIELTKIEKQLENEAVRLHELAMKQEQTQVTPKEASNKRLARILIATG